MFDVSIILIIGTFFSFIASKLKLPAIIGMIVAGIIIGTYGLNLISDNFLIFSPDIKTAALIILMIRAGLAIDTEKIKQNKKLFFSLSFLPATIEIIIITFVAPLLLPISYIEAAMLGSIISAVSPAVIVDRALKLLNKNYGEKHSIPELLLVGGSLDSIYAVLIFNSLLNSYKNDSGIIQSLAAIPIELLFSLIVGFFIGYIIKKLYESFPINKIITLTLFIALCFLLNSCESTINNYVPFSSLITIVSLTISFKNNNSKSISFLSPTFYNLWKVAEIFLFVLVGCSINIANLSNIIIPAIIIIFIALSFKLFGVFLSLLKSNLTKNEKIFCLISFIPKATVQATLGGIPLALDYNFGETFLAISILTIIITTPLGTIAIDNLYPKLLSQDK